MLKYLAIIALMIIGHFYAAGMSCNSCGGECASACGTRRFRTCCFNYLRRKRVPELIEPKNIADVTFEDFEIHTTPLLLDESGLWWRNEIPIGRPYSGTDDEN